MEHFAEGYIAHLNECEDYLNNPRAAIVRVNDKLKDMIPKQKWIHSEHGYPIFKPEIFIKLPGAKCDEYADIATLVMRSKGIPVGIDFTPQWRIDYMVTHGAFFRLSEARRQCSIHLHQIRITLITHMRFLQKYSEEHTGLMKISCP